MVPVFGPSNVRDFTGFVTDSVIASTVPPQSIVTDWVYFNPMIYVLYAVDLRRNINFRYWGSGSPFEYDLVRFLYTKKRELELRIGTLPPEGTADTLAVPAARRRVVASSQHVGSRAGRAAPAVGEQHDDDHQAVDDLAAGLGHLHHRQHRG